MAAGEQLGAEMALQHADAVGDGSRGEAELLAGADEAPVAGGGLEESQALEGQRTCTYLRSPHSCAIQ